MNWPILYSSASSAVILISHWVLDLPGWGDKNEFSTRLPPFCRCHEKQTALSSFPIRAVQELRMEESS
jgi:hypothetical protein